MLAVEKFRVALTGSPVAPAASKVGAAAKLAIGKVCLGGHLVDVVSPCPRERNCGTGRHGQRLRFRRYLPVHRDCQQRAGDAAAAVVVNYERTAYEIGRGEPGVDGARRAASNEIGDRRPRVFCDSFIIVPVATRVICARHTRVDVDAARIGQ